VGVAGRRCGPTGELMTTQPLFFGYTWVSTEEQAESRNGLGES
jgi:hypothetical protein